MIKIGKGGGERGERGGGEGGEREAEAEGEGEGEGGEIKKDTNIDTLRQFARPFFSFGFRFILIISCNSSLSSLYSKVRSSSLA